MIGPGERIIFELIKPNPAKADRSFQFYPAGVIPTAKNFHDDFKMGIGMFNLCQMSVDMYAEINFFFDFSDAGCLRGFTVSNFTARKFPQSSQEPFGLALGDQNAIIFVNDTHCDMITWRGPWFLAFWILVHLVVLVCLTALV